MLKRLRQHSAGPVFNCAGNILSVFKSTTVFHGMAPSYLISEFKRFAHLEKFNLNFSGSSFAIRVNRLHP